jgi:hypothetical protein
MAVVSNTYNTYDTKGIREDLSDVIYNISPEDTPFMSNAGRGGMKQTFKEWQVDSLAAVDSANAVVEGDDVSAFAAAAPTTRVGNYAQISRKTVIVSDTNEEVDAAGRKSELAYQLSKRSAELKRDMEAILCGTNQGAVSGGTAVARKLASLLAFIKTNTDKGGTGADPVYTSGAPAAGRTDGTTRAFTEVILKSVMQKVWTAGGLASGKASLMVDGVQKQVVSAFTGIATKTIQQSGAKTATIIGAADVYVGDFGTITVIPNRFQRSRDAFLLNWDFVSVDYLRKFRTVKLAKTGDAEKRMLLAEYTLRVNNEAALGLAADLS